MYAGAGRVPRRHRARSSAKGCRPASRCSSSSTPPRSRCCARSSARDAERRAVRRHGRGRREPGADHPGLARVRRPPRRRGGTPGARHRRADLARAQPPAELAECQRHEALLNLAFADSPGFRLLCPYDTAALEPDGVEAALPHPPASSTADGRVAPSASYRGARRRSPRRSTSRCPSRRRRRASCRSTATPSGCVPARSSARTRSTPGSAATRVEDLVLAVNELATNSVRHGGGAGLLRVWQDDERAALRGPRRRPRSATRSPAAHARGRAQPAATACGWSTSSATWCRSATSGRRARSIRVHTRLA